MRHRVKLNHLGRKSAHRKALLSHLACDLIRHKKIITTLAKAKALRVYVEPLITKSKTNTTHQRRVVFSYLQDKEAVTELFGDISAKVGTRPGGYTRIIKLGARLGDAAEMALIELVDYNETYSNEAAKEGKRKRTRRGGRSRSKSASAPAEKKEETVSGAGQDTETTVEEAPKDEAKENSVKEDAVKKENKETETAPKEEKAEEKTTPDTDAAADTEEAPSSSKEEENENKKASEE